MPTNFLTVNGSHLARICHFVSLPLGGNGNDYKQLEVFAHLQERKPKSLQEHS
jgi:hypothetical protein